MWRAEDNFLKLVLSSHQVAPEIPTEAVRLGGTCLLLLSLLSIPRTGLLKGRKSFTVFHIIIHSSVMG